MRTFLTAFAFLTALMASACSQEPLPVDHQVVAANLHLQRWPDRTRIAATEVFAPADYQLVAYPGVGTDAAAYLTIEGPGVILGGTAEVVHLLPGQLAAQVDVLEDRQVRVRGLYPSPGVWGPTGTLYALVDVGSEIDYSIVVDLAR